MGFPFIPAIGAGLGLFDFFRTNNLQDERRGRIEDATSQFQFDTGGPTGFQDRFNEIGSQDDFLSELFRGQGLDPASANLFGDLQSRGTSQLFDEGSLTRDLAGQRADTQFGIDRLSGRQIGLDEGFDLLDFGDPDATFSDTLRSGRNLAASRERSSLRDAGQFDQSRQLGIDPFEAGSFGERRREAGNQRFSDLFAAQENARQAREGVIGENNALREGRISSNQQFNSIIEQAIGQLSAQGDASLAGLRGGAQQQRQAGLFNEFQRETTNRSFLESLSNSASAQRGQEFGNVNFELTQLLNQALGRAGITLGGTDLQRDLFPALSNAFAIKGDELVQLPDFGI